MYKLSPMKVMMPEARPEEHADKRFYSDIVSGKLLRAYHGPLEAEAADVAKAIERFDLQNNEHNEILVDLLRSGEVDDASSVEDRAEAAA